MRFAGTPLFLLLAITATVGCDRITKRLAIESLAGAPARSFLSDTIRLDYAENTGGFLSLGADLPPRLRQVVFTAGTAVLLLGVTAVALVLRWQGAAVFGLALLMAGGASNWFDRVTDGHVVDFMNVGIGPLRTGIFNVADVAIMAGAAIVLLVEIAYRRPPAS
jgi:signal peptidase II